MDVWIDERVIDEETHEETSITDVAMKTLPCCFAKNLSNKKEWYESIVV